MTTLTMSSTVLAIMVLVTGTQGAGTNQGNCTKSEFSCLDGEKCIPLGYVCDRDNDCADNSDELASICRFACADGSQTIRSYYKCNGDRDCRDGSDELEENCGNCTSSEFACADGRQCIPDIYKCDAERYYRRRDSYQCKDRSDESPAVCGCGENYFMCADAPRCVWFKRLCDGWNHCQDGSDELEENCGNCTSSQFACADGLQCVPAEDVCYYGALDCKDCVGPQHWDCKDGSDEDLSICGVECADGSKMIKKRYQCDGEVDCPEGSDETKELCGNCTSSEFLCASEDQCISASNTCDGWKNCRDGSDEHTTICGSCTPWQFACADGLQCVPLHYKCDGGGWDCEDGSDEDLSICGKSYDHDPDYDIDGDGSPDI